MNKFILSFVFCLLTCIAFTAKSQKTPTGNPADIYLSGGHVGILRHPPFRADISHAIKSGNNILVVEIANTRSNRLTGDARLSESKRLTTTNMKHEDGPLKKGTT